MLIFNETANASILTIRASNAGTVTTLQRGHRLLMANQDDPTAPSHWTILNGNVNTTTPGLKAHLVIANQPDNAPDLGIATVPANMEVDHIAIFQPRGNAGCFNNTSATFSGSGFTFASAADGTYEVCGIVPAGISVGTVFVTYADSSNVAYGGQGATFGNSAHASDGFVPINLTPFFFTKSGSNLTCDSSRQTRADLVVRIMTRRAGAITGAGDWDDGYLVIKRIG